MPLHAASASCWRPEEASGPAGGDASWEAGGVALVEMLRRLSSRCLSSGRSSSMTELGPSLDSESEQRFLFFLFTALTERNVLKRATQKEAELSDAQTAHGYRYLQTQSIYCCR